MTDVEIPDFMRRAMEAQGKITPDEVAARIAEDSEAVSPEPVADSGRESAAVSEQLPLNVCARCGGNRQVWMPEVGDYRPCPDCTHDHAHFARRDDSPGPVRAAKETIEAHGSTGTIRRGSQKHKLLADASVHREPAIDRERALRCELPDRSCWWHRVSDLVVAGYLIETDNLGYDPETEKHELRRTAISPSGEAKLREIA